MLPEGIPAFDRPAITDALTALYCALVLVERIRRACAARARSERERRDADSARALERIAGALERLADVRAAALARLERAGPASGAAQRNRGAAGTTPLSPGRPPQEATPPRGVAPGSPCPPKRVRNRP